MLGAGICVFGCSDEPSPAGDVSGHWCGKQVATSAECLGDEVQYLVLTQAANGVVTGTHYEAYDHDGYELQSGKYANGRLTYFYTFDVYRVDGDFTSTNGDTLSGKLHTDKCNCDIPTTLYRVE